MVTSLSGKTFQKLEIKKFQMCLKLHHLFQISYKIDTVSPDFPFHNVCISAHEKNTKLSQLMKLFSSMSPRYLKTELYQY